MFVSVCLFVCVFACLACLHDLCCFMFKNFQNLLQISLCAGIVIPSNSFISIEMYCAKTIYAERAAAELIALNYGVSPLNITLVLLVFAFNPMDLTWVFQFIQHLLYFTSAVTLSFEYSSSFVITRILLY